MGNQIQEEFRVVEERLKPMKKVKNLGVYRRAFDTFCIPTFENTVRIGFKKNIHYPA